MKKNIVLLLLLCFCYPLYAQNKVFLSFNPGISLSNSENSTKTLGDQSISFIPGFSIAYENKHLFGVDIIVEYNLASVKLSNVQVFKISLPGPSADSITRWTADYYLTWHNIDFSLNCNLNKWLSFAIGPTISLVYRTISLIDHYPSPEEDMPQTSFDDRLASICAGLICSANIEFPFEDTEQYFFLFSRIKYRYLHSVLFDARGRNLDNYYQSFSLGQINFGVGYCF